MCVGERWRSEHPVAASGRLPSARRGAGGGCQESGGAAENQPLRHQDPGPACHSLRAGRIVAPSYCGITSRILIENSFSIL